MSASTSGEPVRKKKKPARKQVLPNQVEKKQEIQTGKEYNIWYNKWAGGDREDPYSTKVKSQTRCNVRRDIGYTRADTTGNRFICLFFSRGCCPYGYECEYQHWLPAAAADARAALPDSSKDCFGRDKFADYRDDMGGVGTFTRVNRTLYVGRIKENGPAEETMEIVTRHFAEWGAIEHIRVLQHRGVAFVTYANEASAQFAKEAMSCQSLDNDEILNVRWATDDPNKDNRAKEGRRLAELGAEIIASKMDPRILEAVRALKALEDEATYAPEPEPEPEPEPAPVEERALKRRRTDGQPPSGPLLSAETLDGLRHFAELKKKTQPAKPRTPVLALADYGSDED